MKNIKAYAKQIDPNFQDSPFEELDDVIFNGNNDFNSYTTEEYNNFVNHIDEVDEYLTKNLKVIQWYSSFSQLIEDMFPRSENLPEYTTKDFQEWENIILDYWNKHDITNKMICQALSLMTNKIYDYDTIKGCCQRDWQICYYPKHYDIKSIEIEYFNLGTEWIIHIVEEDGEINDVEDITGYSLYCYNVLEDDIKQEIAEETGLEIDEIEFYQFSGYLQIPKYEQI